MFPYQKSQKPIRIRSKAFLILYDDFSDSLDDLKTHLDKKFEKNLNDCSNYILKLQTDHQNNTKAMAYIRFINEKPDLYSDKLNYEAATGIQAPSVWCFLEDNNFPLYFILIFGDESSYLNNMMTNLDEKDYTRFLTILKSNFTNIVKEKKLKSLTSKQTAKIKNYFELCEKEIESKKPNGENLSRYIRNLKNYLYRQDLQMPNDLREKIIEYNKIYSTYKQDSKI